MTKEQMNLAVFLATICAGIACLALGHEAIGSALLVGAAGHAVPSPLKTHDDSTPSSEREERGE